MIKTLNPLAERAERILRVNVRVEPVEFEGALALKSEKVSDLLSAFSKLSHIGGPDMAATLARDANLLTGTINVLYFPSAKVEGRKGAVYS